MFSDPPIPFPKELEIIQTMTISCLVFLYFNGIDPACQIKRRQMESRMTPASIQSCHHIFLEFALESTRYLRYSQLRLFQSSVWHALNTLTQLPVTVGAYFSFESWEEPCYGQREQQSVFHSYFKTARNSCKPTPVMESSAVI